MTEAAKDGFSLSRWWQDLDWGELAGSALVAVVPWLGYVLLAGVAAVLVWRTTRTVQINKATGGGEVTLAVLLGRAVWFACTEDTAPVVSRLPWSRWRNLMLLTTPVVVLGLWPQSRLNVVSALIVVALGVWAYRRYQLVVASREHTVNQLFSISQSVLRYAKGADLVKDQYVQVVEWTNVVIPQRAVVMYPASTKVHEPEEQLKFEEHVTAQAFAGLVWDFSWELANNRVLMTARAPLPEMLHLPFPTRGVFDWNELPLGLGEDGQSVVWRPDKVPHALVAGVSGSGKSVTQRNILVHCLQHAEWNVILIDPKRVELSMYKDADGVQRYAVTDEDMTAALEFALQEMENRYVLMETEGVALYRRLPTVPAALLVMIDEGASLLMETGDKDVDVLKRRNKVIVGRLAREGRAAGVHVVLASQRPDATWLGGDTRETVEARVAMGRMSWRASEMTLNNRMATRTDGSVRGRGIFTPNGADYHHIQSYYLDEDDVKAAIPWCNQLRAGTLDCEEARTILNPQPGTTGSDSASGVGARLAPAVGVVGSWWSRVSAPVVQASARLADQEAKVATNPGGDGELVVPRPPRRRENPGRPGPVDSVEEAVDATTPATGEVATAVTDEMVALPVAAPDVPVPDVLESDVLEWDVLDSSVPVPDVPVSEEPAGGVEGFSGLWSGGRGVGDSGDLVDPGGPVEPERSLPSAPLPPRRGGDWLGQAHVADVDGLLQQMRHADAARAKSDLDEG